LHKFIDKNRFNEPLKEIFIRATACLGPTEKCVHKRFPLQFGHYTPYGMSSPVPDKLLKGKSGFNHFVLIENRSYFLIVIFRLPVLFP